MNLLLYSIGGAITDVFALLVVIMITIQGAKKGFIKSLLSTFGTIFSFLFAVLLCSTVTGFLETKFSTVSNVGNWVSGILQKLFGESLLNTKISEVTTEGLANNGLGSWLISAVLSINSNSEYIGRTIGEIISPVFAYYIVCALSLLGLYILFKIIFFIIADLSQKIKKVKVVGPLNVFLGGVFGLIKSVIIVDLCVILLGALPFGFIQGLMQKIDGSFIIMLFDKVNVLGIIFNSLTGKGLSGFLSSLPL